MQQVITIQPVTRIEGHARIRIHLDEAGEVRNTRLEITSLRGFEQFAIGRPAEEILRIVTRICGICPWMHHLAAAKAIDACFGVEPPPAGQLLRELCHLLAHVQDKILHFFFLAAPDFFFDENSDVSARSIVGLARREPELAERVVRMRQLSLAMLDRVAGKALHPVAAVVGGFAKPLTGNDHRQLLRDAGQLLDFACFAFELARERVFDRFDDQTHRLGTIATGFLGTVDLTGGLRLYDGTLRLMHPDGGAVDFAASDWAGYLVEHTEPWSHARMVHAHSWGEGFSLDPARPRGIYRVNPLARLNVCDHIATPRAQAELVAFRSRFGWPVQTTMLTHWARLIELVHVCERILELLADDRIVDGEVRASTAPRAGHGVGHVEAPRGTLIHEYATDQQGCITHANLIVGTTHNVAPMNLSVHQAAASLIHDGVCDDGILNRIEMALRAYDP